MSTATPQPQLSLDELRRLKWLLGGALALVSLWTTFFLDIEAIWLVAIASAVILAALVWPQLPARIPAAIWRLAVPAIVVALAVDFYFSAETLPVLIRVAILLVLYRAIAYRRKREDLQLIVLGLFLIVVGGVLTVSIEFAFLLLLFTACTLGFLFVVTLIDMVDTGPKVMRPEEMREVPAWARGGWGRFFARLRTVIDWRLIGFGAVLFVGVVGISALLFLMIPRFEIGSGFFLDKYITRKSRSGFTETVRFGEVSELVQDTSVAMRVDVSDLASVPEKPYWRLVVLDEYTPQGFKVSAGLKEELRRNQRITQLLRGRFGGDHSPRTVGGVWTFYVEPGVSRFLPLPGTFGNLRMRDPAPLQQSLAHRIVGLRSEQMSMLAFQIDGVELTPFTPDPALARVLSEARRGTYVPNPRLYDPLLTTRGPVGAENEETLARVVREITRGEDLGARDFALRAGEWLGSHHAYALSASLPRGTRDDIVKWLDSDEPGFCEFFAGALAVLSRTAGHPSRVVAGFRGGSVNGFESYIMVRNSEAHAWVEIFDRATSQWMRVDPTPGGNIASSFRLDNATAEQEQDSSWSARFDSLRVIWYRRIVNFDARQQVEIVEAVKSFTNDSSSALRARLEAFAKRIKEWFARPWDWQRIGRTATALGAFAAILAIAIQLSRLLWRRWQQWRHPGEYDPVRRQAGRVLAELREVDAEVWTPELRDAHFELQRLRYGARESWSDPAGVFKRARHARRAAGRRRR